MGCQNLVNDPFGGPVWGPKNVENLNLSGAAKGLLRRATKA